MSDITRAQLEHGGFFPADVNASSMAVPMLKINDVESMERKEKESRGAFA